MNVMSKTEFVAHFKRIEEFLPVKLTSDGRDIGTLAKSEDIIVVSDLHPFLRNKLRALEARARSAMPPEKTISNPPPRERGRPKKIGA